MLPNMERTAALLKPRSLISAVKKTTSNQIASISARPRSQSVVHVAPKTPVVPYQHSQFPGTRRFTSAAEIGTDSGHDPTLAMLPFLEENQIKFVIITNPEFEGQSDFVQDVIQRLHFVIGEVPFGRCRDQVSRTPLRILQTARHPRGENMIAFKLFNGSRDQRDAIVAALEELPEVHYVGFEGPGYNEW